MVGNGRQTLSAAGRFETYSALDSTGGRIVAANVIQGRPPDSARVTAVTTALQSAGEDRGRWWTTAEWGARWPHPSTVRAVFGSWAAGWSAAGYRVPARWALARGCAHWTRAQAVAVLRRVSGSGLEPLSEGTGRGSARTAGPHRVPSGIYSVRFPLLAKQPASPSHARAGMSWSKP